MVVPTWGDDDAAVPDDGAPDEGDTLTGVELDDDEVVLAHPAIATAITTNITAIIPIEVIFIDDLLSAEYSRTLNLVYEIISSPESRFSPVFY